MPIPVRPEELLNWRHRAGATLVVPLVVLNGRLDVDPAAFAGFAAFVALEPGDPVAAVDAAGRALARGVVAGPPLADPLGLGPGRVDPGPALWVLRAAIARVRRDVAKTPAARVRLEAAVRVYDRDLSAVLGTADAAAAAVQAPVQVVRPVRWDADSA